LAGNKHAEISSWGKFGPASKFSKARPDKIGQRKDNRGEFLKKDKKNYRIGEFGSIGKFGRFGNFGTFV